MIISQTPVRISLSGGGTDFPDFYEKHEGFVISTAINKYIYVIIKPRFDNDITVNYRSVAQHVKNIDNISHDFIREAAKLIGMGNGFDIITLSDVPTEGSGLGSSSSLIVGLLNAMATYRGVHLSAEELARMACELEINILNKPIGEQDQYIAAYGGFKSFAFHSSDVAVMDLKKYIKPHVMSRIENNLFLHYIPTTRDSNAILTEQKNNIPNKEKELLQLYEGATNLFNIITGNTFEPSHIGAALKISWLIKKNLSTNISNFTIDNMIQRAHETGALGSKVAGAGGGGFLISYVEEPQHTSFTHWMSDYTELPFKFEENGSKIIFNN